jgi:ABC-type transporter Mla maintaining outer membrane lipid asymmetry ATPase subunit MlaF
MLLAQDPRLLLVDEPAAGMTRRSANHTTEMLSRPRRPMPWWSWSTTWNSSAASTAR